MELSSIFQYSYKKLMIMCLNEEKEKEAMRAFICLVELYEKLGKITTDVKLKAMGQECFAIIFQRCVHTKIRLKAIPFMNHELSSSILAEVGKTDKDPAVYNMAMECIFFERFPLLATEVLERADRYALPVRILAAVSLGNRDNYELLCKEALISDQKTESKIMIFSQLADRETLECMPFWLDSVNVVKEYRVARWIYDKLRQSGWVWSDGMDDRFVKWLELGYKLDIFKDLKNLDLSSDIFDYIFFNAEEQKYLFERCLDQLKAFLSYKVTKKNRKFFLDIIIASTKNSDPAIRLSALTLLNPDESEELLVIQEAWQDDDINVVLEAIHRTPMGKYPKLEYKQCLFSLLLLQDMPRLEEESDFCDLCQQMGYLFNVVDFSLEECYFLIVANTTANPKDRELRKNIFELVVDTENNYDVFAETYLFNLRQKLAREAVLRIFLFLRDKGADRKKMSEMFAFYLLTAHYQVDDQLCPLETDVTALDDLKKEVLKCYTNLIENMTK